MYSLGRVHDSWWLYVQSGYSTVAVCTVWLQYMTVGGSMYSLVTVHDSWWQYVQPGYST